MSSIQRLAEKIKGFKHFEAQNLKIIPDDLFLGLIIVLVAFGSFGLGRLSKIEGSRAPVRFENVPEITAETFPQAKGSAAQNQASVIGATADKEDLVASKNGTKYYYPWCSGVKNISPANLTHFASKSEAEARGYTASATCKGL
ncbi:MAG: hypothetical protein M0P64_01625 [Candidatus Pacebacteria bacterium]|jgi:hypothetical protein|nr:hypothetical protein [Candidatus Paceibacterota bacterium]